MWTWALLALALCAPGGLAYRSFTANIPNGDHVPHPCKPNFIWHGVGHRNAEGGGDRNPFGEDFDKNGQEWTAELCRLDSDGDGLTNGQELGDPDCTWTPGKTPTRTTGISHPGVCDPWNEGECVARNTWVDCSSEEYRCDYIDEPDVLNFTIRFPRTLVPAKETSYFCFNFQLPDDQEYHLIATEPIIDNPNVMHHMVLLGCDNSGKLLSEAQDCMMGVDGCSNSISVWTLGMAGECFNPQAGFRIGKGGITRVSLQHHWTNPHEVETYYDSSGLILYYTPKLRRYNAAAFTIGQTYLEIPPRMPSVVHQATCTSKCTRKLLKGPIHITTALNHMHYLGIRQNMTLIRPGRPTLTMTDDNPYNYDTPHVYTFDTPVVMEPGDELKTYCTYQSLSRGKTTLYGPGSFEEMCFVLLTYFPAENIETSSTCIQWKDVDFCDDFVKVCDWAALFNSSAAQTVAMVNKILDHCDPTGKCRAECPAAVEELREENACINNMWDLVSTTIYSMDDAKLLKFAAAMSSCDQACPMERTKPSTPSPRTTMPQEPAQPESGPASFFLNLVKQLDVRPLLQNIIMNVNYNNGDASDKDHANTWY